MTHNRTSSHTTTEEAIPFIEMPLEVKAHQLALELKSTHKRAGKPVLLDDLCQHEKTITQAYHYFRAVDPHEIAPSYVAEWLLDNFFLIQQSIRQIREDLPLGYYHQLPKVKRPDGTYIPRNYILADDLINYMGCQLNHTQVIGYLRMFQVDTPLTMGELWAFPTMLRLGILNNLADELNQHLEALQQSKVIEDNSIVRFCVISLRLLANQDWKEFFEQVSLVDDILRNDPIYATMTFKTRNSYRESVERLARIAEKTEESVALQAIIFSEQVDSDSRQAHVGYYLIGDGKQHLQQTILSNTWSFRVRYWLQLHVTGAYLASIGILTFLQVGVFVSYGVANGGNMAQIIGVILLTLLPATAIANSFINWWVTYNIRPNFLPRLNFEQGIPSVYQTMVVIPTLLNDESEIDSLLQQLELHFLRNTDPALFFALLTDYVDAPHQHMPNDDKIMDYAQAGITALNAKYPAQSSPFYLFHRERQWNESQNTWMGWERKRGKLTEFNHLLRGKQTTSYIIQLGDLSVLPHIQYVITLDADTVLPEGSARRLIETLAHPLNQAEYDADKGKVVAGYSILQPRIEIKPTSANQSRFTRIFAGDIGLDLYTHATSDVYQDLFGEGSYVGKGIYDVDILERCLADRIPENMLLSHDLFEGIHARVGLTSDIILFEEYPASYLSHTRRQHRWIRGDWQLLPWLLPNIPTGQAGQTLPNTFSALDRWKILDNLRRSLVTPALLMVLIVGWLGILGHPLIWVLVVLTVVVFPFILSLLTGLLRKRPTESLESIFRSRRMDALRGLLAFVFLPYEAVLTVDAVVSTWVRLFFTQTRMLQWTTAAQTEQHWQVDKGAISIWRQMAFVPLLSVALILLIGIVNPLALWQAVPILVLWFLSPQLAYWLSLPDEHIEPPLSSQQKAQLRHLARQTWLFFEQTVSPADHWLPPDHFQDAPHLIAHRTSPTNIGLLLTSTLCAYDLGYIGHMDLLARLQATFDTLDQLELYRGHLLNWYDTQTLTPLEPRYVSTVDSGNLAGALLIIQQACSAFPTSLTIDPQRWQGLLDTLGLLEETLHRLQREDMPSLHLYAYLGEIRQVIEATAQDLTQWASSILWLNQEAWETLSHLIISVMKIESIPSDSETLNALQITSERFNYHLISMNRDIDLLMPWLLAVHQPPVLFTSAEPDSQIILLWNSLLEKLTIVPQLGDLASFCEVLTVDIDNLQAYLSIADPINLPLQQAYDWCEEFKEKLAITRSQVELNLNGYQTLTFRAETYFTQMDFAFLFDTRRKLFHIGYRVINEKLDDNFYDLLASEARLASFLAIAKREVSPSHWLHLGRSMTQVKDKLTLLSWSGTMFEYLMPNLYMQSYEHTFLTQSCWAIVDNQIAYGQSKGVPWGISESSYYAFDSNLTYQYHAFGVPNVGLRRETDENLVITPYASLLAIGVRPQAVYQNIQALDKLEMRGLLGFYEAIDYTPSRLSLRQDSAIVRSYMAHHQGMIIISLTNYLLDDVMVKRFHADLRVQSFAMLLQEKIPHHAPIESPHPIDPIERVQRPNPYLQVTTESWRVPEITIVPQVHILSNGRLSTLITNAGSGYNQWQGIALNPWEADTTLDDSGTWVYIQDLDQGKVWSAGYQPTTIPPDYQHVAFSPHQVEFQRRNYDITVNMQITIGVDDDVEIRQINLINHSDQIRHIRVTSYAEVMLAPSPVRHPTFNKLFIASEYIPDSHMLLFHRRLREGEKPLYLAHLLLNNAGITPTSAYESDRLRFVGRGRTLKSPIVLDEGLPLSGTVGLTLDPIMALGQDVELLPYARVSLAYLTLVASTHETVTALARRYQDWATLEHTVEKARHQSELNLQRLKISTTDLAPIQQLLSLLLYPHSSLRASAEVISTNTKGQSSLWAYGISGDLPILLVRLGDVEELGLLMEVLRAHMYWREHQTSIDLVILNLRDSTYSQELQEQIQRLMARSHHVRWQNRRGGIFILNADQIQKQDRTLIETVARVILDGSRGLITEQIQYLSLHSPTLPLFMPSLTHENVSQLTPPLARPVDLQFDNGSGGFSADGKEYVIYLEAGQSTPAPWVNVIANEQFGFLVSESGGGYTWSVNSSENRLTPWRNDPVRDVPSEALYLRDEETGEVWSPMPLPSRDDQPYLVRHGAGYSTFEHHSLGLRQVTQLFVALNAPVKMIALRLENTWDRPRRITITYYAEWVLGVNRSASQAYIVPEYDHERQALLARNPYNVEFENRVAFLATNKPPHGITTDRTEFLGRVGDVSRPIALNRIGLTSKVEAGVDPCAVIQIHVDLPVGGSEEVFFLLGEGQDREEALRLIEQYQNPDQIAVERQAIYDFWDQTLGTITVKTPDPAMNIMLNRWLLYQSLSCRIWGRSGLYQSGGAFGFRDQLQDVMALLTSAPQVAREHILRAAQHQFEEGDVLHWWHPPTGRGVRTRCSDDMLWLPFVVNHYIKSTGDSAILDEHISFLCGDPLRHDEEERYGQYESTQETYSLYEHCRRAIKRASTVGVHGLPLMGAGDWNDGMSHVGIKGHGESVWLGWFVITILKDFIPLSQQSEDFEQVSTYEQQVIQLKIALERAGWDGNWYRRAYYDDGTPLGSSENIECQIDSLAQSWAVLSGEGDSERSKQAMASVAEHLIRSDDKLLLLFTPPFDQIMNNPGYIKSYPPGIRENGGQYTHAALWVVWAFAKLGEGNLAHELFRMLNVISHTDTPAKVETYRVEPYVVAADVYSVPPHTGRGGWTWYTGSASWMYRLGIEGLLGLTRTDDRLRFNPCIPKEWAGYEVVYQYGKTHYHISISNPYHVNGGVIQIYLDDETVTEDYIVLSDDGLEHCVKIGLG